MRAARADPLKGIGKGRGLKLVICLNIYDSVSDGFIASASPRLPVRCVWSGVSAAGVGTGGESARLAHQFHHLGHHLRVLLEEGVELVLVLHERLQLLLGHTDDGRAVRAVASSSRWQGRLATAG